MSELDVLIKELSNVNYNGKQNEELKDGAKDWLWNNIDRIIEALVEAK